MSRLWKILGAKGAEEYHEVIDCQEVSGQTYGGKRGIVWGDTDGTRLPGEYKDFQ